MRRHYLVAGQLFFAHIAMIFRAHTLSACTNDEMQLYDRHYLAVIMMSAYRPAAGIGGGCK